MDFFHRLPMDKNAFATTILLLALLNIAQYVFGYGLVEGMDPWSLYFGFPFFYYEQGIRIQPLERILYLGIVGNFIFAVAIGFIAGVVTASLKHGSVFFTATVLIVLLNAGQYFIGYGGFGIVEGVEPSGLTLGFPFTYYHYSFSVYEGEVIYLGIIGNLIFAGGLGATVGGVAALVRKLSIRGAS